MALRKGQKELVEQYRGGYCGVPAIPGGGKTYCLTMWACEIISQGFHKPGKILIVTYMNSAVNNFKQRINEELKKRGITSTRDYHVTTIHGLCLQIIREKPDLVMADDEFDVLDGVKRAYILNTVIDEWKKDNYDLFKLYLKEEGVSANRFLENQKQWQRNMCSIVGNIISEFKSAGIGPSESQKICASLDESSILKWAADMYLIYDRKLKSNGLFDFDDMLQHSLRLLKDDADLLSRYRRRYTYICEDESQDSNPVQNSVLRLIAGENGNFLRVGDSNQSIMSTFTNSDFTLFRDFCSSPGTTTYNITQSNRSTIDIINLANHFTYYVTHNHPTPQCRSSLLEQYIEPVAEDEESRNPVIGEYGISAGIFNSWNAEVAGITAKILELVRRYPDKTIAVLSPNSYKVDDFVKSIKSKGIPYEELDNESEERTRPLRKLGRTIDFIAMPENNDKFCDFVNEVILPRQCGNTDNLTNFLLKFPPEELLYPMGGGINRSRIPDDVLNSEAWKILEDDLELIRQLLEFPVTVVEKLILFIAEKLEFNREERAVAQKVASDVRYLMSQNPRWRLADLAVELNNPKNIFNMFAGIVWELKGYKPQPGVVTISTYHKAKGLEWDTVFLTGINNADFPAELTDRFIGEYKYLKEEFKNPLATAKAELHTLLGREQETDPLTLSKIETISERARLLYVGITRARERLFLSAFRPDEGKRSEFLPSRYIYELKKFIEEASAR